jgi:Ca2+-transporting ATPase
MIRIRRGGDFCGVFLLWDKLLNFACAIYKNIPEMTESNHHLPGLSAAEVLESRKRFGSNRLYLRPKRPILKILAESVTEPVFLLLALTCALYFAIGDQTEAWLMVGAVIFVTLIEIVQEFRSEKALAALREFSQPKVQVIRDDRRQVIAVEELVVDDLLVFEEGERISADGTLVRQNDLSVDEAVLTGESLPVNKTVNEGENRVFQGTVVASGMGIAQVKAVGAATEFGKLGKSIESIESEPTPLQRKIDRFVRQMLLAGLVAFLVVFAINYAYKGAFLTALLYSLSFALALVPQEIPVAFATFMALGAFRMTRQKVLVKQPKTVESLGAATVICLDKTGTITENRMSVAEVVDFSGKKRTLEHAMWASEPEPFDAMEKAIHAEYEKVTDRDRRDEFDFIYEYPLGGVPPMMTHVYKNNEGERIIAGKGAVERILKICKIGGAQEQQILEKTKEMARKGFRVLGVASAEWKNGDYPKDQDDFDWQFEGLVALYDPPKPNIRQVMNQFYDAGIEVKMVTGDYPETALNVAHESGIRVRGSAVTGEQVMQMPENELVKAVGRSNIFARMFPDAKLRVVNALKFAGEIVAMTGDGVNDGPALKAAPIGVAMGKRGTEIAKSAASMVLLDDDLTHMIGAIKTGRRIYNNLRKAIRYIISIHLPIVLVVLLPLLFGWPYLHMLMPIHVIFLELIMDPTCAVAFENEPSEPNWLKKPPHSNTANLFSWPELSLSIVQGTVITAGIFATYHYAISLGKDEATTRSFVFVTTLAANIFLTLVNRSFEYTIAKTIFYKNNLLWGIIGLSTAISVAILFVPALREMFLLGPLSAAEIGWCSLAALVSVGWFEVWKWFRKRLKST